MKEEFEIRTMGFRELAQMYNPHITPLSASNMLSRWIVCHPSLLSNLQVSGYKKYSKTLTPKQVELITSAFGFP